ncbi:MAG TPA: asparagine synthase (glutamine-hydrolyzing) [Terrimicrobiaceae bacterium]
MCGIAGFVGEGDRFDLERMTRRLAHRGPDAEGFYCAESDAVHFGHRRLSIIDLAGGAQPMLEAEGRCVIVFNGEIYNHLELRADLEARGRTFQSDHSDTEVLLHGYCVWGEEIVHRLNGMWAFALWDSRKRRLLLSRDRFGKKPLFWFRRAGTLAFASELTALLEHGGSPRSVSRKALQKFFAYSLVPAPNSLIEGVCKLPAGHNLILEAGGEPVVRRYWRFEIEPDEGMMRRSEKSLAEELLERLDRAVKRRLMADVPLGVFLSGGIDSTAVAALAAKHAGTERLRTFSIGFNEPSFDESAHARRAAEFLGTDHQSETLDLDKACDVLPEVFQRLDEPQGDNSLLPTWLLSRFTRRQVTVALGGDGGDELFAGYDTFRGLRKAEWYARMVPRPVHHALRALAGFLPVSHANLSFDFKVKRGMRGASHQPPYWNPVWLGALEPHEIAQLFGEPVDAEDLYSEAVEVWDSCRQSDLVDRTLQFYTELYLQDGILAKVDRASMMHGLEARSPFLDLEVADFARRLPHCLKIRGGTTKYLLKKALEPVLPLDIIYRKKKGFGTPVGVWFRLGRLEPRGDGKFLEKKLSSHRSGAADERLYLWCQLCYGEWLTRLGAEDVTR